MNRKFLVATTAVVMLAATPALAQEPSFYVKGEIGSTLEGDVESNGTGVLGSTGETLPFGDADLDAGIAGGIGIGVENAFFPGMRFEAEVWASNNETSDTSFTDDEGDVFDLGDADEVDVLAGFANAYYDIANYQYRGFTPYVGGGIGLANIEYSRPVFDGAGDRVGEFEADDEVFAWNLQAGLGYKFNESWTGQIGYRYLNFESADLGGGIDDFETTGEVETDMHAVTVGMRYRLGGSGY